MRVSQCSVYTAKLKSLEYPLPLCAQQNHCTPVVLVGRRAVVTHLLSLVRHTRAYRLNTRHTARQAKSVERANVSCKQHTTTERGPPPQQTKRTHSPSFSSPDFATTASTYSPASFSSGPVPPLDSLFPIMKSLVAVRGRNGLTRFAKGFG